MPPTRLVHGDKGYDSNAVRRKIESRGAAPNIPPKSNRRWKNCFSPFLYRDRNAIERMFGRLKDFRRIATRYDRSANNFLAYVDQKRLDGSTFYRAMKLVADPLDGLIQGGLQGNPAKMLPPIAHEPTTKTGLSHKDGTISLARYAPGTATCDFFICIGDVTSLDADPTQSGDNQGFAAFGHVVAGMDVVKKILTSPVSPTKGQDSMKGQMLDPEIAILTARRI